MKRVSTMNVLTFTTVNRIITNMASTYEITTHRMIILYSRTVINRWLDKAVCANQSIFLSPLCCSSNR